MIHNKIMLQNRYNKNDVKNENQNSHDLSQDLTDLSQHLSNLS